MPPTSLPSAKRILRALRFQSPDRAPRYFGGDHGFCQRPAGPRSLKPSCSEKMTERMNSNKDGLNCLNRKVFTMKKKPKIAVLLSTNMLNDCVAKADVARLKRFADVAFQDNPKVTEALALSLMQDADGCLTGWKSPTFSPAFLEAAPRLKIIAHSAGSIKAMLLPVKAALQQQGIHVTSAAASMAIGVAEFTLGMMVITMKRVWRFTELTRQGAWRPAEELHRVKELYGATIGVVAASLVGRQMIRLLRAFEVTILVYDPYLSAREAAALGVKKVPLEILMKTSDVVTIHAPKVAQTRHMINRDNLRLMKDGAILINTARGSVIDEQALIHELKSGRITACLDVTDPEPPAPDSPFRKLPNVILTPHIAGAVAENRLRNGKQAVDDLERFFKRGRVVHAVNLKHWDRLA